MNIFQNGFKDHKSGEQAREARIRGGKGAFLSLIGFGAKKWGVKRVQ